jgi:putative endonuclease
MTMFARIVFGLVNWAARRGLGGTDAPADDAKQRARRTGIRGETFAYWYLRRHGYVLIARNFTAAGVRGELDLVGMDGEVLAFVEVKTRAGDAEGLPEDAVTPEKRRYLARIAQQFRRERRMLDRPYRFDVLAIESRPGRRPDVRLHKGAFSEAA